MSGDTSGVAALYLLLRRHRSRHDAMHVSCRRLGKDHREEGRSPSGLTTPELRVRMIHSSMGGHMNENLKRLRDAVSGRGREVEVAPDGSVREVSAEPAAAKEEASGKATKLAPRTFGSRG